MRPRSVDIYFSEETGLGYIFVTDVVDSELVKLTIDKTPRGSGGGVLTFATLTEAQARKLRDALAAWIRRNEPEQTILPIEPPRS